MKLLVVALDGFPYHLLKEYDDRLPNISRVMRTGSWGRLDSTVPYVTATAWTSFITGMDPGKHGVLGFFARQGTSPSDVGRLVAGSTIRGKSLWECLSEGGKKVGVFGVPMTYPPEKVNGFVISGFPLPRGSKDYVYPEALREDLSHRGWDFSNVPTQSFSKDRLDPFYEELKTRVKEKTDAVLHLMGNGELDFFMVHYFETDKLLHEFLNFRYAATCSEEDYRKYHDYVDQFMLYLDAELGRVLSTIPSTCNVLFVSDHGLAAGNHVFMCDTWLMKEGYIKRKSSLATGIRYGLFRIGITPEWGFRHAPGKLTASLLRSFMSQYWEMESEEKKSQRPSRPGILSRMVYSVILDKRRDVDWSKTKVYSFGGYGVATFFLGEALMESEKGNTRAALHERLAKLEYEGKRVFDHVYYDSEIYKWEGDRHDIPDVLAYDDKSEYVAMSNPAYFTSNKSITRKFSNENEANHDRGGIYIAAGPDFAQAGEMGQLAIMDMLPTILHLFDLPVGTNVDGLVAEKLYRPGSETARRTPRFVEASASNGKQRAFTNQEEAEITQRLKEMGYV